MSGEQKLRSARLVIDQAIRENRRWEWTCLVMTITFAATGVVLMLVGAFQGNAGLSAVGVATGAMFWPAVRAADDTRRANMAIRLMEIPLGNSTTADEAATAIQWVFLDNFGKGGR